MPGVAVYSASTTLALTPKAVIAAVGVGQYLTVYRIRVSNPPDSQAVTVAVGSVETGTHVYFSLRPGETRERTFKEGVNWGHNASLRFACDAVTTGLKITVVAAGEGSPAADISLANGTSDGDTQVIVPIAANRRLIVNSIGITNSNVSSGSNVTLALNYATAVIIFGTQGTGTTGATGFVDFPMGAYQTMQQTYDPPLNIGVGQGIFIKADALAGGIVVDIESRSLALDVL